jgi:dihydrofolate synthase/folylpolyglutamate synthase
LVNIETSKFLNNLQRFGWKLGLDNIRNLLRIIGNPQQSLKGIHIAGTNGKGSTAAMLESIFSHAGFKTGLYTSPHLINVEERIRVAGKQIPSAELEDIIENLRPHVERLQSTYFETLTAAAFHYFNKEGVEVAIVEVGLGGRLDATNVFIPEVSLITSVAFDHAEYLGTTLAAIAREKAGILKTGVPCILQSGTPEVIDAISAVAREIGAPLHLLYRLVLIENSRCTMAAETFDLDIGNKMMKELRLNLRGEHQVMNAALAVAACELLKGTGFEVSDTAVRLGLESAKWPGRLQIVEENPMVVIDVAHNPESIQALMLALKTRFTYRRLLVIVGLLADKDIDGIVQVISADADTVISVGPKSDRALSARKLQEKFSGFGKAAIEKPDVISALETLKKEAGPDDMICILGSHYVLGDFLANYATSAD